MKCLIVSFITFIYLNLISGSQQGCEYKPSEDCGGWLKFNEIPMTWSEARLTCHYEGAELASPTPQLIETMRRIISYNKIPSGKVFTGIHATYFSRRFSTLEGLPLSRVPHQWAVGEPNNVNDPEDCLAMNESGALSDLSCNSTLPFICYRKFGDLELNKCGTFDNEYVLDSRTGSCYKFHGHGHTWSRAYMICEAEGGYLAIINSEQEEQIMRDLLHQLVPRDGFPPPSSASLGFRDINRHRLWVTIKGQSLKEAGYDFSGKQPDNYGGKEYCGGVFSGGGLVDNSCTSLIPFICEKDPNITVYCTY